MDRRRFLKLVTAGSVLQLTVGGGRAKQVFARPVPGGTLDPRQIGLFIQPLRIPSVMPLQAQLSAQGRQIDYYEIAARQLRQQVLPPPFPQTTVWGYGSPNTPGSFGSPGPTIEARYNVPTRIRWINDLTDPSGNFLPHLFAVDPTLHWANPPGPVDAEGQFAPGQEPRYHGPVPLVTHVHGAANVGDESDGYPEAWYLPAANNLPSGYARQGTWYAPFAQSAQTRFGATWSPGSATGQYPNRQNATTLWYHDHALGITRLNVQAGLAGFYLIRSGPGDDISGDLPGPAPRPGDPAGRRYREIPLLIQDRSFHADGSLFFPDGRAFFDGLGGPFRPDPRSDLAPIWNPEFFANTISVNGCVWPYHEVEPRRYRLRIINGCNARTLLLRLEDGRPFVQIGADQGFLPRPTPLPQLLMAPGERADLIVDFGGLPLGATLRLINVGPDEPYGGGECDIDFERADPATTGQVMQFRIVAPRDRRDESTPIAQLRLPAQRPLGAARQTRFVSLNELGSDQVTDATGAPAGPRQALCGVLAADGRGQPLMWSDPVSENPQPGTTEVWAICNFTEDAHPIHVHNVAFEIVSRAPMDNPDLIRGPEPGETGLKDTVIAYPGELMKIKMRFVTAGVYVWHCHILDHEDNEMMRPYVIGPIPKLLAARGRNSQISPDAAGFICVVRP